MENSYTDIITVYGEFPADALCAEFKCSLSELFDLANIITDINGGSSGKLA